MNRFDGRGPRIYDDQHIFNRQTSQGYAQGDWGTTAADEEVSVQEEFATEIADFNQASPHRRTAAQVDSDSSESMAHAWIGWVAAICAILSLFMWPLVLAPAAMVMGLFAWAFGNRWTGSMSAVLAVISLLAYWLG